MKVNAAVTKVTTRFNETDDGWELIGTDDLNQPIQFLGSDAGEPEDKMLVRDLSWVEDIIQALLDERAALKQEIRRETKANEETRNK